MAKIISADDIKKELAGYTPEKSGDFHLASTKLADKRFDECLQSLDSEYVILMSGGPASDKTEFISEYLIDKNVLIFDGILPTERGAEIKIRHCKKAKKGVCIYAVWPLDFKQAYAAFLHRDRKYSDEHFFAKHASSRQTLLWIAHNHPEIEIKLFESTYLNNELRFTEVQFDAQQGYIAFLRNNQYTDNEILTLTTK